MKPYDVVLVVGRFQLFHIGHESLMNIGKIMGDRLIILIGSAQESGTERNPFNIATRIKMLKAVYGDDIDVQIYALNDLTNEKDDNNTDWGKYVLGNVDRYVHKVPELMIYGDDRRHSSWFEPEDLKGSAELIVPRSSIPISATQLRDLMVIDNRKEWMKYVNPKLHKMYDELRAELMAIPYYQQRYNQLMAEKFSKITEEK